MYFCTFVLSFNTTTSWVSETRAQGLWASSGLTLAMDAVLALLVLLLLRLPLDTPVVVGHGAVGPLALAAGLRVAHSLKALIVVSLFIKGEESGRAGLCAPVPVVAKLLEPEGSTNTPQHCQHLPPAPVQPCS